MELSNWEGVRTAPATFPAPIHPRLLSAFAVISKFMAFYRASLVIELLAHWKLKRYLALSRTLDEPTSAHNPE